MFHEQFENPGSEYSAIPFWFLDDRLDDDEIKRQMDDFKAHGIDGVVLHPRIGLPESIGYLSPAFFHFLGTAIRHAAKQGMSIVLYDEGMYPSGSASGLVVAKNPRFASVGLALAASPSPEDTILFHLANGFLVSRPTGGTIRGIHYGEDDGEKHAPRSADILNPEAVRAFIQCTHEAYWRHFRRYFGNTIKGFFTDEPTIIGRNVHGMFPWSLHFENVYQEHGGRLEDLAALFAGEENEGTRLYHTLIKHRLGEVYYGQLSAWCSAHHIALMGHPEKSWDITMERRFTVPGQDLVLRWLAPETGDTTGPDSVLGKCSSDAAFLYGKERNSNELFGGCGRKGNDWHLTGSDRKWYIDYLAVRGVNLFFPHAFYYSIRGKRLHERAPDVGPHNIAWDDYQLWSTYFKRVSAIMSGIKPLAKVLLVVRNDDLEWRKASVLFQRQVDFLYLPDSSFAVAMEKDGKLWIGNVPFDSVIAEEGLFPSVPHVRVDEVESDLPLDRAEPMLRVRHFSKEGTECWFLANAGEEAIGCGLLLDGLSCYEPWTGEAYRMGKSLHLGKRETLLLYRENGNTLEEKKEPFLLHPAFHLVAGRKRKVEKVYKATLLLDSVPPNATVSLLAEEAATLFVNGVKAGTCMFSPMSFPVSSLLRKGRNSLTLNVYGSLANRYGKPVPYGLLP